MIRHLLLATVSLFLLPACADATATNELRLKPETKPVTRAECLAKELKAEKITCFKILAKQREAELKATHQRIETIKIENEKLDQENEALLKEFEKGVLDGK